MTEYTQPNTLRDGETTDTSGHAGRTNQLVRDGRAELARQELTDEYHRCSLCNRTFDDVDDLATHDCEGGAA